MDTLHNLFDDDGSVESHDWGEIRWVMSGAIDPSATMTVGFCRINPGQSNPRHVHPNCDEVLVVVSGLCRKQVGESTTELGPGDSVRIPRGAFHQATAIGDEPLVCVISYDTPDRQIEFL